jgi:hypothetical protein
MQELGFEVLTAVKVRFFWVVTPCSSKDAVSVDLWSVDILPQHYTVSQPRTQLEYLGI